MVSENRNKFEDVYEMTDDWLGEGGFGAVFKCTHRVSRLERACKKISLKNINNMARFE